MSPGAGLGAPTSDHGTGGALRRATSAASAALVRLLVAPLRGYRRFVSPYLPPVCRFHPSCSAYAIEALQVHGPLKGSWLTARRLLRCAPWHPGGHDPVPPRRAAVAHPTDDAPEPAAHTIAEETLSC